MKTDAKDTGRLAKDTKDTSTPEEVVVDLRAHILDAEDIQHEKMIIPEWGNIELQLWGLTGGERADVYDKAYNPKTEIISVAKLFPSLVIAGTHDPDSGRKVFNDGDLAELNNKSAAVVARIAEKIMALSGLRSEDLDEAKKE